MRTMKGVIGLYEDAVFCGALLLASLLICGGCAPQQPSVGATQYKFVFEDKAYRLRTIYAQNRVNSYNELIGENFVAADLDQDRILDSILLGEVRLEAAQHIYDHGLTLLAKENKLRIRMPSVARYTHASNGLIIEITSFRPEHAPPFNQLKIFDQRSVACPQYVVMLDQNADGTLDKVLKGSQTLTEIQPQYREALSAGLQKGALHKLNGMILVKEN